MVVSSSLTGARERVSAAKLCSPLICLRSVVNSEIKERWPLWRGLQVLPVPVKAKVRGLWSVYAVKERPSRKYRKCLIAR